MREAEARKSGNPCEIYGEAQDDSNESDKGSADELLSKERARQKWVDAEKILPSVPAAISTRQDFVKRRVFFGIRVKKDEYVGWLPWRGIRAQPFFYTC